jgi:hypothetical protein
MSRLDEVRMGRNWLRSGDPCRVSPSRPNKRDGGVGKFLSVDVNEDGEPEVFNVFLKGQFRSLRPGRVSRVVSTKEVSR